MPTRVKEEWEDAFLATLRRSANVRLAAKNAGIDYSVAYRKKQRDPIFSRRWDEAKEQGVDLLEAEAFRRAMASSDRVLMFLLKAHRRNIYGDQIRVHTGVERELIAQALRAAGVEPTQEHVEETRRLARVIDFRPEERRRAASAST